MPWLCSDHEKKNTKTKEVYWRTKDVFECFSLLLACCLLCALVEKKVKAFSFFFFFYDKESFKFPTHYFLIFKTNYWQMEWQLELRVLYRLPWSTLFQPTRVRFISELYYYSKCSDNSYDTAEKKVSSFESISILFAQMHFLKKLAQYFTYMRPPCFFNCYVYHYRHHRHLHNSHQWPQQVISTGIV